MERSFSPNPRKDAKQARATRPGTVPLLVLLLAGLLTDVAPHNEAYASLDYTLSLLALLGAAGCIASFTYRLSLNAGPLPWAGPTASRLPAPAVLAGISESAEDWPLLVALLLGPLVVLLAGFGGWV